MRLPLPASAGGTAPEPVPGPLAPAVELVALGRLSSWLTPSGLAERDEDLAPSGVSCLLFLASFSALASSSLYLFSRISFGRLEDLSRSAFVLSRWSGCSQSNGMWPYSLQYRHCLSLEEMPRVGQFFAR